MRWNKNAGALAYEHVYVVIEWIGGVVMLL